MPRFAFGVGISVYGLGTSQPRRCNVNIYITASLDTRVKRIAERDGTDYKKAKKETINRTNSEIKRFQKMYELDVQQKHIYDLRKVIEEYQYSVNSLKVGENE